MPFCTQILFRFLILLLGLLLYIYHLISLFTWHCWFWEIIQHGWWSYCLAIDNPISVAEPKDYLLKSTHISIHSDNAEHFITICSPHTLLRTR